ARCANARRRHRRRCCSDASPRCYRPVGKDWEGRAARRCCRRCLMRLGIFAKTFARPTLEAVLDAVRSHGLDCVQFNMACAGLPSLPDQIELDLCKRVREAFAERQIEMAAVSGTFNMIHPSLPVRRDGLRKLRILAEACGPLGTRIITLCTGT